MFLDYRALQQDDRPRLRFDVLGRVASIGADE